MGLAKVLSQLMPRCCYPDPGVAGDLLLLLPVASRVGLSVWHVLLVALLDPPLEWCLPRDGDTLTL